MNNHKNWFNNKYFETDLGYIVNGDCLEEMRKIPDNSIDMVLADLPYGIMQPNHNGKIYKERFGNKFQWDVSLDLEKLFKEYARIIKSKGRVVLTSSGEFTFNLYNATKPAINFSQKLIWNKEGCFGNHLKSNNSPVNTYEDIMVFTRDDRGNNLNGENEYANFIRSVFKDYSVDILEELMKTSGIYSTPTSAKTHTRYKFALGNAKRVDLMSEALYNHITKYIPINISYSTIKQYYEKYNKANKCTFNKGKDNHIIDVISILPCREGLHPTQKPLELFEQLMKIYSNKGELILDNTAGVMTTALAAENLHRKWICIEKEEKYCELGKGRFPNGLNTSL